LPDIDGSYGLAGLVVVFLTVNSLLTGVNKQATVFNMIRSFKHKGLKETHETGRSAKIRVDLRERCLRRLDALNAAGDLSEINVPGFDFHGLEGKPKRYSIHVNGPFCITFEWVNGEAWRVDLENYH
jgi:proteic killer suppression protein